MASFRLAPRHAFAAVLVIAVFIIYDRADYLYAQAARNYAWLEILQSTIKSAASETAPATLNTEILDVAISMDTNQPRLSAFSTWYEGYKDQVSTVQTNQSIRLSIQAALQCSEIHDTRCSEKMETLHRVANETDDIEAWLALAFVNNSIDRSTNRQQILERLSERLSGSILVNDFFYNDLKLIGYDLMPLSEGRFASYRVVLYWQSEAELSTKLNPSAGLYQWDIFVVQVIDGHNRIANGNFEWISLSDGSSLPSPWTLAEYDPNRTPSVRVISDQQLIGQAATVQVDEAASGTNNLRLRNILGRTFLSTIIYDLDADTTYLLLGQFRAPNGTTIQVMQNVNGVNQFPIRVECTTGEEFAPCAGIFSPPDSGSVYLHLHLSGPQSIEGFYDNLGLFEMESPGIQ